MEQNLILHVSAATHNGGKLYNEDSIYMPTTGSETLEIDTQNVFFAVADGVSSGGGGGIASQAAIKTMHEYEIHHQNPNAYIKDLLNDMNNNVRTSLRCEGYIMGGSTIALINFHGDKATTANIGDSYIYLCRQNKIQQLNRPHTLAALKQRSNNANINDSDYHTLYYYIGNPDYTGEEQAYINEIDVMKGDAFLICSDGFLDLYDESELIHVFSINENSESIINDRIEKAKDNVSLVIIKVI